MGYNRSIGTIRRDDYLNLINMLEHYLQYVQQDHQSSNDDINLIKLMIEKIRHNMDLPYRRY